MDREPNTRNNQVIQDLAVENFLNQLMNPMQFSWSIHSSWECRDKEDPSAFHISLSRRQLHWPRHTGILAQNKGLGRRHTRWPEEPP